MVRVSDAHPGYAPVVGRAGDAECGSRAQNEASSDIDCVRFRWGLLRTREGGSTPTSSAECQGPVCADEDCGAST